MKKIFKLVSSIIMFTTLLQAGDYRIISPSGFTNAKALENGSAKEISVLATPNAINQFMVLDLITPKTVGAVNLSIAPESNVSPKDILIYSSMSIIPWTKVETKNTQDKNSYTISLQKNFGQYLKIVFGSKPRVAPIKILKLTVVPQKESVQQKIINISVNKITLNSAELSYETVQPSATQVVYGTNYDYVYGNVLASCYSEPNRKLVHKVSLGQLQPNITYAYSILAKDSAGKDVRSQILYISTRVK